MANDVRTTFASDSMPERASTPKKIARAPEDDNRVGQQDFDLSPADLAMGCSVVVRILKEVSDQGGPDGCEPIRPLDCRLSVSANGTINVNVGAHTVGTLPTDASSKVMAAIVEFGGNDKSLAADGDLLGDDASTAHLHLWAPTL